MEMQSWLGRKEWYFIIGVPLLSFAFAPFPGLGFGSNIRDILRGHPGWAHGSHPQKFVGLWIREEFVKHDFQGQAFYLMVNGRVAGRTGMTMRSWHFDRNTLFVDSFSTCGNCYAGNLTTAHTIMFTAPDQMVAASKDASAKRGITGTYRRVEITDALKTEMKRLVNADKYLDEWYKARAILGAIEQFEVMSKPRDAF